LDLDKDDHSLDLPSTIGVESLEEKVPLILKSLIGQKNRNEMGRESAKKENVPCFKGPTLYLKMKRVS